MLERLAVGTLTTAAITSNASYLLSNFPEANPPYSWLMAYSLLPTPYTRRTRALSGRVQASGKLNFTASLGILNNAMLRYLYIDLFGYELSKAVTVYIRDRLSSDSNDAYAAINCTMELPELNAEGLGARLNRWYVNPVFQFYDGVYAG